MQVGPASILDISRTFTPARGPVLGGIGLLFVFKAILRSGLGVEYNEMTIGEQKLCHLMGNMAIFSSIYKLLRSKTGG